MKRLWALLVDEQAATAVEYAVMLALILVVCVATISAFGDSANGLWGGIDTDLDAVGF
ncbi:MAG: Flp family type IVb pilin [Planctomycetaceae bacterium]